MTEERKVWFGGMSTGDIAQLHPRDVAEELERFGPIERVEMKERCFIVTMESRRDAEKLIQHPRLLVCGYSCIADSYKSKKAGPFAVPGSLMMTKGNGSLGIDAEDRLEQLKANKPYSEQLNMSSIVEKLKDLSHILQVRAITTYLQSDLREVRNPMGWFSSIIRTLSLGLEHGTKAHQHGFNGRGGNGGGKDRPHVSIREDLESPRTLARKLVYRSRSRPRRRRSVSGRQKNGDRAHRDQGRRQLTPLRKAAKGAGKGDAPKPRRSFSLVRSGSSGSNSKSQRKSRSRSKSSSSSRSRSATNNVNNKDDAKSNARAKRTFVDSPARGSRPSSRRSKPPVLLVSKEEALDGWSSCSEVPENDRENDKNQRSKPPVLLVSKEEALDGWSSCSEVPEDDRGNDTKKLATQEEALDGWESASPDDEDDKNDKMKRNRSRSADSAMMPSDHGSLKSKASGSRRKGGKDVDYLDNDQSGSEKPRFRGRSRSCLVTRSRSRSPSRTASPNRSRSRSASPPRSRSRSASPPHSRSRSISPLRSRSRSRSVSSAPAEMSPFERRSAAPTPKSNTRQQGMNESPQQKHRGATEAPTSPFEFTRRRSNSHSDRRSGASSPQAAESVSRAQSVASSPAAKRRIESLKKDPPPCVLVPNTHVSSSQLAKAASNRAVTRAATPKLTSRKESARRVNAAGAAAAKQSSAAVTAAPADLDANKMPKASMTKAPKKTADGKVAAPVVAVSKQPKQTSESKKQALQTSESKKQALQTSESKKQALVAKQAKQTLESKQAKQAQVLAAKQAKHAQALKQAKLAKHALALKQAKQAQASKVATQTATTKQVLGTAAQRLKRQREVARDTKETAQFGTSLKVASRRLPDSISPRTRALLGDGAKWLKKEQDAAKVDKDKLKAKSNLVSLLLKAPNGKVKHVMHRAEATIREILQAHGKDPLQYRFLFEGHRVSRDVSVKELKESIPAGKKGNGVLTLCLEKLVRVEIFLGDEVFEEQLPGNMTVADLFEDLRVRGLETDIDNLCCQNKDGVEYGKDLTLSTLDAKSGSSKKGKPLKLHVARGEWDSD